MNKKYKLLSWISIVIVVVIFILVNIFMTVLTKKFPLKIDLTSSKMYELSNASYDYLKGFDKDTTIYVIGTRANEDADVRAVLDRYAAANSKIKIDNVDIKKNPSFGKEFISDGSTLESDDVIVSSGDKFRIISGQDLYLKDANTATTGLNVETKITSALKFVASADSFTAYFTTGHNEENFAGAKQALQNENYSIKDINTMTEDIPQDASVIIVSRPQRDFSTEEIAKLDSYVRAGGALEVYVDSTSEGLDAISAYLSQNGITLGDGRVADVSDHATAINNTVFFISEIKNETVATKLAKSNKAVAYVPYAKPLITAATSGAISVSSYLASSDKAAVSIDGKTIASRGASDIALMSENSETNGKIFVSGSLLMMNYGITEIGTAGFGNAEFVTSITNEMTGAGDTFVVPVKSVDDGSMVMSVSTQKIYIAIIIFIIPGTLLALGLMTFFKRRNM